MTGSVSKYWIKYLMIAALVTALTGCGFHLRGEQPLAPQLHSMYLKSSDPYGTLSRNLKQSLKMSKVHLTESPAKAQTILEILRDDTTRDFLGVSGTQQTRQYKLTAIVVFQITDNKGKIILPPQGLSEERNITIQSNQILGSSNEASLFFKQMQRGLASAIMYRLSSIDVTKKVRNAFPHKQTKKKSRRQTHS